MFQAVSEQKADDMINALQIGLAVAAALVVGVNLFAVACLRNARRAQHAIVRRTPRR